MSDSIDGEGSEPTIAPAEPDEAGDRWSVSGATSPPGDRTFVATLWLEDALGRTVTGSEPVGEDGHFEISFRRSDLVPGVARFVLSIDDRDTGRSGVDTPIPSADREITVTDLVPAPAAAEGYAALLERLRAALTERGDIAGGADDDEVERVLSVATTERLAELSEAMGVATSTLEDMRTTVRTLPIGLAPAVGFVLVSAGLDLDVDALVEDEDLVRTAVELAVSRGLVDVEQIGAGTTAIGAYVVRLLGELAALDELGRPAVSGGIPIVDLVELALNEVDRADMLALAELVAAHDVLDDTFWTAIEDANWRTDDDQRALRHVFWLDELTLSSRPLVAHLIGSDPALSIESAVELTVAEWEDLIQDASNRDESAVPDRFRTGGTQAQREAYAVHIASRLRRTHPSRAGRLLVVRVAAAAALDGVDNPLSVLTAMLEADPEFDVVHGELGDEPAAVQERRLLQRALAGDDRDPVEAAFRYAGETARPVQAVARMGQRAFSAREGSAETYLSAAFANAAVITVYSDLRAAASAPRAEERVELTDWSNEFGEIDDTACEHCASVYSPAAYLVDLLRFVLDRGIGDHLLGEDRRPDLVSIELSCANTETALPYIDLVNEVLESAVLAAANDAIDDDPNDPSEPYELPPVGQTTTTDTDELRAHPEHLEPAAYDVIAEAVHPFSMPFDLWHAEARSYLALAGVDRAAIRRVMRPADDTALDELGLFAADRSILDGTATVRPNYRAPDYGRDADKLRRATGLGFEELAEVLGTQYVIGTATAPTLNLDEDPETIEGGFGIDHARRIHRLLLLAHRLDLDVEQVDRGLGVVDGIDGRGRLGQAALHDLASLRRLTGSLRLRFEEVAMLFADAVSTRRRSDGRSDFEDWFVRPTATDPRASRVFELDANGVDLASSDALVAENDSELRAALGIDAADFAALQTVVDERITLRSLADLIRWTLLSRALRWSVPRLIALVRVSQVGPFARSAGDPGTFVMAQTELFVDNARRLGAAGVNVEEITNLLLHPLALDQSGPSPATRSRLESSVTTALAAAEDDADRNAVTLAAVSEVLDLDPISAGHLLDHVRPPGGDRRTTREVLLDTSAEAIDRTLALTADRLELAAGLVRTLGLPPDAVELLFDSRTGWLDPHLLPLASSDLTTETDRPDVAVLGPAVIRADAAGNATIPLMVEVDGAPFTGAIEWRSVGSGDARLSRAGGGWRAAVAGVGPLTLVATVDATDARQARGTGAITVNVRAEADWPDRVEDRPDRVEDNLIALYDFHEGAGATVGDVSMHGEPLDLELSGATTWLAGGGLVVDGKAQIRSTAPATKVNEAIGRSGEITVEAWISPANAHQGGPARIFTISADPFHRNVTLAQNGSGIVGRFRTATTGDNGTLPATSVGRGLEPSSDGNALHHVVYTRAADGGRLFVDGREVAWERRVSGSTDGWSPDMHLGLADELGEASDREERSWRGTYHLVAIYDKALSDGEISRHHALGPAPALPPPEVVANAVPVAMLPWDSSVLVLDVSGSVDAPLPETVTVEWTTRSGPAIATFETPTALETTVSFPVTGDYVLGLRARDRRDSNAWAEATIAVRIAADPAGVPRRWGQFVHALDFSEAAYAVALNDAVGPTGAGDPPPGLFALLKSAIGEAKRSVLTRHFIDELGTATGVGHGVDALVGLLIGESESSRAKTFGECQDGTALARVARAAAVARRTGTAPRSLVSWSAEAIDHETSADIRAAVRSTFEPGRWLEVATELRDDLRERQRDALVGYLLALADFDEPDDIYGHFLIDVQMSSCQLTSRLKQAISSVQQFVQRTLLGIERASLRPEDADQWRWMKAYRLWEANRKVFLHPENWLEPDLRSDKSPFFEELEADLAQVELTDESAGRSVAQYLEKLHAVANLEIVGMCHEHDGTTKIEPSVLHVVGRTRGQPRHYWHRTLVAGIDWTPWRSIEADLMGDHIVPVFHNGRLSIFSAEFEAKEDPPADPRSSSATARSYARCTLAHTELSDGQWSAKVLSEGAVNLRPSNVNGRDIQLATDGRTGQLDFSPFSFHVSVEQATNDLRIEIGHRSDDNMQLWSGFELPGTGTGLRALGGTPRRVQLDRRSTNDRFVGFGFGSGLDPAPGGARSLAVIAAPNAAGQLVPALTAGRPAPVSYRAVATTEYTAGFFRFILTIQETLFADRMRARGWRYSTRIVSLPTPRISPPPPASIALEFVVYDIAEDQKAQVERLLRQDGFRWVDFDLDVPAATPRVLTLVDGLTPPWSAVASARVDLAFDRTPFVVQDKLAAFLVTPTPDDAGAAVPAASLSLLTHPMVGELRRELGRAGVDGLLAAPPADARRIGSTTAYVTPHVPSAPADVLDFGAGGAFSSYHWELFIHLPLLISKRLTRNQRFDEAQRWLHYIFDPTAASKAGSARGEPWQVKPFLKESMAAAAGELAVLLGAEASVRGGRSYEDIRRDVDYLLGQIHDHPFDPHVVARLRTSAYKKAVVMAYLDNLIAWADHLFSIDTLESINEAAQLYVIAADILGERPAQKPARSSFDKTFVELDASPSAAVGNVIYRIVPPPPEELLARGALAEEPPALTLELGFCVPANPKLLGYWDVVADRLYKVRHCQNIEGLERALALFAPPIDPGALVRAAAAGTGGGAALRGLPIRTPHYRYRVLHDRAVDAANQVRRFGGTFTNALVSRDREALAELLSSQEVAMTEGTRSLLRLQRDDARSALEALEHTRRSVEAAKEFVDGRQDETELEAAAFGLETAGVVVKGVSAVLSQVAGFVGLTPKFTTGASGIASPVVTVAFGGNNLHKALDGIATGLATTADVLSGTGGLVANRAELERRKAAFAEDRRQAAIELARVLEEIEGAQTRVAIAADNIATLEAQIVNVRQVQEHLRTRFTDGELWGWMVGRGSEIFFQAYSVALDLARRAERAFQIELGDDDSFISAGNWDSLRKGLLSGDGLLLDLTRMDAAYLDRHRRAHELRLRISLDDLGGIDALRTAGKVDLRIPESELDRRTPGHFRRRVKSVAVTVQGRNGSLDLPAKITLLKATTRVRPDLAEGYRRNERVEDSRFVDEFGAASIVTSGRAEDTGLFARDYDDDRYLPFEGVGLADSLWEIDLFADTGADLSSVADVELVIDYSAVDGGTALRAAAVAARR